MFPATSRRFPKVCVKNVPSEHLDMSTKLTMHRGGGNTWMTRARIAMISHRLSCCQVWLLCSILDNEGTGAR